MSPGDNPIAENKYYYLKLTLLNDTFAKFPLPCAKLASMGTFSKSCAKWTMVLVNTSHRTGGTL